MSSSGNPLHPWQPGVGDSGYGGDQAAQAAYASYPPSGPYPAGLSAGSTPAPGPGFGPPPPANAGWAVAALLFFWPLAFSAFNHAFNVYPLWAAGDHQGAHYASERAKQLGKYALWIFIGLFGLFVAFYVVAIVVILSSIPQYPG